MKNGSHNEHGRRRRRGELCAEAGSRLPDTVRNMLPPERAAHRSASAIFKRISLRTYSTYSLVCILTPRALYMRRRKQPPVAFSI